MKLVFRPRLSLRTLLLLVTAFTVWLGLTVSRARKQMAAVDVVVSHGGSVYYDFQIRKAGATIRVPPRNFTTPDGLVATIGGGTIVVADELHSYRMPESPDHPVPKWVRNRVVDHIFASVVAVHLEDSTFTDRDAKCFEGFPNIRLLSLSRTRITDKTLTHVAGLKKLEHLAIDGTNVEGSGLVHLEHLLRLETLELGGSDVTDDGIRDWTPPKNLKSLRLDKTRIGDDGLAFTRQAINLERLSLGHTNVRGRGLRFLADCPKLRTLSLEHSRLNDSGLEKLAELPFLEELELPWVAHRTTHISASAARRIEKALPDTEISYPP